MLFLISQVLLQTSHLSECCGALWEVLLNLLPCNCCSFIFHTLLISAHKPVMSERKKMLYNLLVWSADSGSSHSASCVLPLDLSCSLPAESEKPTFFYVWIIDINLKNISCLFETTSKIEIMPQRLIIQKNYFPICMSLIFLPHLCTPVPFPHVPRGDFRTRTHYTSLRCAWLWEMENLPTLFRDAFML